MQEREQDQLFVKNKYDPVCWNQTAEFNLISSKFIHIFFKIFFVVRFTNRILLISEMSRFSSAR
jgi:hypothetical protein